MKATHNLRRLILSFEELNNSYSARISNPETISEYIRKIPEMREYMLTKEVMISVFLNNNYNPLGYKVNSIGTSCKTTVDIKDIAAAAILSLSKAVIIAHNHPSGNLNSSDLDKQITKSVEKALELFDIKLLDSLILTESDFTSIINE